MPFCQACILWSQNNVFKATLYGPGDWYELHSSLSQLFQSVGEKCPICIRVYQLLSDRGKRHIRLIESGLSAGYLEQGRRSNLVTLRPLMIGFESGGLQEHREVIINAEINGSYFENLLPSTQSSEAIVELKASIDALKVEIGKYNMVGSNLFMAPKAAVSSCAEWQCPASSSTSSSETLGKIQSWIQDCASKHAQCVNRRREESWYPTRLLDVGSLEDNCLGSHDCRLTSGINIPNGQRYLTLSHRWGSYSVMKLTTGNLGVWERGLPLGILSRTFQDFIELARRMKVRYVWIDSLCIIQDGDGGADWLREASTMADVYTNAFCNVSADWGTAQNGLYFDRDPKDFDIPCLDMMIDVDGKRVVESFMTIDGPASGFWNDQVTHSPLNERAWVLQERLLSPRILHFCPQEVLFECCETAACERYPDGLPLPAFSGDAPLPKIFQPSETNSYAKSLTERWKPRDTISGVTHSIWPDIVSQYSRCHLTFASDKLVAISGIARYLQTLSPGDIYVVGLWANSITAEMAWHRSWINCRLPEFQRNILVATQGLAKHRAPSFSWANIDFPVTAGDPLAQGILPFVRCVNYRSKPGEALDAVTESIFGPLSSPVVELQVTGYLKRATLQKVEDRVLAIPFADRGSASLWPVNLDSVSDSEDIGDLEGETLFYIPWQIDDVGSWFVAIFFRLVDSEMARFQRIGIMRSGRVQLKELYMRVQDDEPSLPCEFYHESTGTHRIYVI